MVLRRAYAYNLRPVVGAVALIAAIWSLLAVTADKHYEANKLATFAVVLGIIYAVVTGIEAFGVMAAISQRLWMARIYALLSVGSALAAVAAGFMRVIVHFTLKEYGFWGPTFDTKLSAGQANDYCKGIWSHDSAVEIISLIIEMLLAAFFCMLSFAYYHQLLDPTSAANVTRRPGPAAVPPRDFDDGAGAGAQGFPSHYNPPYLGYDAPAPHAVPPYDEADGAKGDLPYGGAKPPMYSEDDIATYGRYGAKAADPFADFDEGKPRREATGERGEFV
ncbi:uncharacterized protein C8Q71DRAFT_728201 [Rhodofomes roseus]|uniref:Uncharacterized protein n=1 Tax=Rhodofomes roseus TaxID=34475 RepID=A0ABQ8JYN0_9APHY|nr:uncharacterized protein C8Q71DRAFT_728201 [Rhodofomes roseus]KAH9829211.1 hypothetical protein C8Q71DRAFT_728201 [Rhodofomes roseus]